MIFRCTYKRSCSRHHSGSTRPFLVRHQSRCDIALGFCRLSYNPRHIRYPNIRYPESALPSVSLDCNNSWGAELKTVHCPGIGFPPRPWDYSTCIEWHQMEQFPYAAAGGIRWLRDRRRCDSIAPPYTGLYDNRPALPMLSSLHKILRDYLLWYFFNSPSEQNR